MTIYLDNAATSFPKPEAVYVAMDHYSRDLGIAVGRGAFGQALEVQGVVKRCRVRAAELLGAESPDRVSFTFNCTDSLNTAIHGLIQPGDHVVTTVAEHNSVLRPLRELQQRRGVKVSYVGVDAVGRIDPAEITAALRPETRLIALTHASNVTGTIQPIADVGEIARKAGLFLLVDAAQSAGHVPIDLSQLPVDILCCAGHKGLLGPLGTGLLYLRPGLEEHIHSFRQGGTGTQSDEDIQPESLPDKYESGNHNAPGLFGLEAALDYLLQRGVDDVQRHAEGLMARLLDGLAALRECIIHGPTGVEGRVGVVSVALPGIEPQDLAAILDERFGIQVRAGLHCAPRIHQALGTAEQGGTVRISPGPFSTEADIDAIIVALKELAGAFG